MPKGIPKNGINKGWFKKEQSPWNKNKTGLQKGWSKDLTKETNESVMSISKKLTGRILSEEHASKCKNGNLGRKQTKPEIEKRRNTMIEKWNDESFRKKHKEAMNREDVKKKCSNPHIGRKHSEEEKLKRRKSGIEHYKNHPETKEKTKHIGKDNGMWNDGSSFKPYSTEWTEALKKEIRKRDNYTCQECNKLQEDQKCKLSVHHIDYNKQNCNQNNLITLCSSCHQKTNTNRKFWEKHFNEMMI